MRSGELVLDDKTIQNIIEKLQLYMERNNQTMHGLAMAMGFIYQPFYRLMTKKSLPTINSVASIAQNLNCSVSELTNEHVFLDIRCFSSIENYFSATTSGNIRMYLLYEMLKPQLKDEFFALQVTLSDNNTRQVINNIEVPVNTNYYQVFSVASRIDIDGYFLVKYRAQIFVLEVLSISRASIVAKYEGNIVQIASEEIEVFAKFFSCLELPIRNHTALSGMFI